MPKMHESSTHGDPESSSQSLIREADVRAIVRLLGKIAGSTEPIATRKRDLMNGLCELIDADLWTWLISSGARNPKGPTPVSFTHNIVGDRYANYLTAMLDPQNPPPYNEHAAREFMQGRPFTRRRVQWLTDREWYESAFMKNVGIPNGVDDFISSVFPLGPDSFSGLGLARAAGKSPFSERDTRIVHIILSEIDWLHAAELPDEQVQQDAPKLTPRQRAVLLYLLEGKSRQEIAGDLGISAHTANDHVKAIYKCFDVNSHPELLRRFRNGDGGDVTQM